MVLRDIAELSGDEPGGSRASPKPAPKRTPKKKAKASPQKKKKTESAQEHPPKEPEELMKRPASAKGSMKRPAGKPESGAEIPRAYKSMYKRDGVWSLKQYDRQVMTAGVTAKT